MPKQFTLSTSLTRDGGVVDTIFDTILVVNFFNPETVKATVGNYQFYQLRQCLLFECALRILSQFRAD